MIMTLFALLSVGFVRSYASIWAYCGDLSAEDAFEFFIFSCCLLAERPIICFLISDLQQVGYTTNSLLIEGCSF